MLNASKIFINQMELIQINNQVVLNELSVFFRKIKNEINL
jgi:hypothetical protein